MNPDNPFIGKSIAVTGKLENYTRAAIKARLVEPGAKPVSKVSKRTDYLILGERPGNKRRCHDFVEIKEQVWYNKRKTGEK